MSYYKIITILSIFIFVFVFSFSLNAVDNNNLKFFIDLFGRYLVLNDQTQMKNIVSKIMEKKIIDFMKTNNIISFKSRVLQIKKVSNNKFKINIIFNLELINGVNNNRKLKYSNIKAYFIINGFKDKLNIEETNLISKIEKFQNESDGLSDWIIIIPIIYFGTLIPFLIYINLFYFNLKQTKKAMWSFLVIFLSIIGMLLFYFVEYKKSKKDNIYYF